MDSTEGVKIMAKKGQPEFDAAVLQLPGHPCCPGCAGPIVSKLVLRALGKNVIFFGTGGCGGWTAKKVPCFSLHFSGVGTGAAGIASALEMKGREDIQVVSFAGDGGTSDIGLAKLSACAERGDNILHFCCDNEGYMNTGIQKSHLTPYGAWTSTTPVGKSTRKKDLPMIMAYHCIPYVATATVAYTEDFIRKVRKGASIRGFKYIHVLQPCPTGWRYPPDRTVEMSRLAVQTRMWNLYEIENGTFRVTLKPRPRPVSDYLSLQGRFAHLKKENMQEIQARADDDWKRLEWLDGRNMWMPWVS